MNIIQTISTLLEDYDEEVTPYGVAMLINDTFVELGSDHSVTPQMLYQYASKGVSGMKMRMTHEEAAVFILRYVAKKMLPTQSQ